jgi:type 1 fimbria pilin
MKNTIIALVALSLASVSTVALAENKVLGGGTIHFSGAVVAPQCELHQQKQNVTFNCYDQKQNKEVLKTIDFTKGVDFTNHELGYSAKTIKIKENAYRVDITYL